MILIERKAYKTHIGGLGLLFGRVGVCFEFCPSFHSQFYTMAVVDLYWNHIWNQIWLIQFYQISIQLHVVSQVYTPYKTSLLTANCLSMIKRFLTFSLTVVDIDYLPDINRFPLLDIKEPLCVFSALINFRYEIRLFFENNLN